MVSVVRAELVVIISHHELRSVQGLFGATLIDVVSISEVFHKPRITYYSDIAPPACGVKTGTRANFNLIDQKIAEKVARPCGHCYRGER